MEVRNGSGLYGYLLKFVNEIAAEVEDSGIDTYYASTYYPWVRYYDSSVSRYISLPVTKDVVRNMADVDNRKYPWYAPAGIERGNVECNKARIFTKLSDENTIYDGRINPVKTFSVDGVKIWGNKTLYTGDTPMNRINTVRLVLYMRKLISQSITSLIFEPNDTTLKAQFEGIVNPILQQIKDDRGITDFRLVVSQTPEQMDEHEISAQLWIKPTPTLEYIELDFIVTPQGVDWNE
jgi:phage tail sheath protein FI